jgi:hypothetical protein
MSWIHKEAVAAMPTTVLPLLVPICHRGHHLSLVRNWMKVTEEAHVRVPVVCQMVWLVGIDHNPCPEFKKRWLLQCPPLFCSWLFLFDPDAILCHWWEMESKWLRKHMYGYQQCDKKCSWSLFIIIHVLSSSQRGSCCNAHHCFAVVHSYLSQRQSFATGEESSQSDQRSTCMGTSSVSNSVDGLYWS